MSSKRVTVCCTAVAWIPSEAMDGLMRIPLDVGLGHYDPPPPDHLQNLDVDALIDAGRCRFINRLEAWATIENGKIVASGSEGGGRVATTEVSLGPASLSIPAVAFPDIRSTEAEGDRSITFIQTAGGRTGAPFPRRTGSGPFMKVTAPTAWSTVAVTINGDGSTSAQPRGASCFPRHWFYGPDGRLMAKSATIDYRQWTSSLHDDDTPWGDGFETIEIAASETALERTLSKLVMQGRKKPDVRRVEQGNELMRLGEPATTMMLVLDGLVEVSIDGTPLAEAGPGTILGERAVLESGRRTSTVRALTPVKVVVFQPDSLDREQLQQLSTQHQRETERSSPPGKS